MAAALAQDPRVGSVRQTQAAMLFRNDEPEKPQVAQSLDKLGGLSGITVPALEVRLFRRQEVIDGIQHRAKNLPILIAQRRIRKQLLFQNPTGYQTLHYAHSLHLLGDA